MDTLKELYNERDKVIDKELHFELKKIVNQHHLRAGAHVAIKWDSQDKCDLGYLIKMPCMNGEYDYFVHVPDPTNISGKDNAPPIWKHLIELISFPRIDNITIL